MSYVNVLGEAPDATSKRLRVNQSGQLLAATADFPPNGSVLLGTAYATALQADSVPLATADPAQGRPGWYYTNTTLGNKMNWYYFDGTSSTLTYADLKQLTCVMTCDGAAPSGDINVPYFVVYFKNGKRITYQNQSSTIQYIRGQKVLFYYSLDAFEYPQNPEHLREVACPINEAASDTVAPTDQVQYITVHSDSAFPAGTFTGVFSQLGFKFNSNTVLYELVAPVSSGSGSDVNITNTFLDTHAALYVGGTAVGSGNPVPVSFSSAPSAPQYTVLINDTGDSLEVDGTTLQVGNTSLSSMTFDTNNLNVRVANSTIPITNTNIDTLSFTTDKGINYLNTNSAFGLPIQNNALKTIIYDSTGNNPNSAIYPLYVRPVASSITTNEWTLANFSGTTVGSVSEALEASNSNSITVFGVATHSGGGGDPTLTYQYSMDNITFYDTPYLITLPNATAFEDTRALGVPWVRFRITSHALDTITLNICRK